MEFGNNSNTIIIQPWFIPMDILMILCTAVSILLAFIYILIILLKKICHTVPMMLVANSCLAELVYGSNMLAMAVFTYQNDVKQIQYYDTLCIIRGYLGYVVTVLQNYSYLLQAIYRFCTVVYPTKIYCQTFKFQLILICSTWIFGFVCPIPYLLLNEIQYDVENQICQMVFKFSIITLYNALCLFMIPMPSIIFIYFKLVRFVRRIGKNTRTGNALFRAQRELTMVRRIVMLISGVATIGLPYTIFFIISFFTAPPRYHLRIAYIFVDVSLAFVMIALLKITDPIKSVVLRRNQIYPNTLIPAFTADRSKF